MKLLKNQKKPDVLILVFSIQHAPVEFGGEGREIPHDLKCPECRGVKAGCLWRHTWYERFFRNEFRELKPIRILRLRCSKCGKTQACLFDFLVPYRQYSPELLGEHIWPYLLDGLMTYEEFEWNSADGKGHRNLVFTVIEQLCHMYVWLAEQVVKGSFKPGEPFFRRSEPEPDARCVNAGKARTERKAEGLNQVAWALMRFKKQSGTEGAGKVLGLLQRAGMRLSAPVSLLTGAKVLKLYAPLRLKCRLF